MKTYEKNIENRKELVSRLEELTGLKAHYTFMPRCAYEIGAFTVEKDGGLTVQDDADESILETLIAEGMIKAAEEQETQACEEEQETGEEEAQTLKESADTEEAESMEETETTEETTEAPER